MGEYADFLVDEGMDDYHGSRPWPRTRYKTCHRCGARRLEWTQTDHGWRLMSSDGEIHSCNDFQNIEIINPETGV